MTKPSKPKKVTRILYAQTDSVEQLSDVCRITGFIRADIWRRYGALGTLGKSASDIRKEITVQKYYSESTAGWHNPSRNNKGYSQ